MLERNPAQPNRFCFSFLNLIKKIGEAFTRERDRWPLWAPLAVGTGIIIYFQLPFEPSLWALMATPLLVIPVLLARNHFGLMIALSIPLLIVVGFNAGQIETKLAEAPMLEKQIGPTGVTGRLVYTELMPKGVRLTLKDPEINRLSPEMTPLKVRVRMQYKNLTDVPPTGSLVNLWAELGPFSEPVMPHATDFRWQAYFKQLGGLGWSMGEIRLAMPIRRCRHGAINSVWRSSMRASCSRSMSILISAAMWRR